MAAAYDDGFAVHDLETGESWNIETIEDGGDDDDVSPADAEVAGATVPRGVALQCGDEATAVITANASARDPRGRYTTYQLRVQRLGTSPHIWHVYRRYRDFRALHDELKRVGFPVPPGFPNKRMFGSLLSTFVRERQAALSQWLGAVLATRDPTPFQVKAVVDFLIISADKTPPGYSGPPHQSYSPGRVDAHVPQAAGAPTHEVGAVAEDDRPSRGKAWRAQHGAAAAAGGGRPPIAPTRALHAGGKEAEGVRAGAPRIGKDDFELLKVIGKGSFGKVLLVRKRDSGQVFAMKVLNKSYVVKRKQVEHTKTERRVLQRAARHPFLVSLHFAFQSRSKLFFVMDFCGGGELFFHLGRAGRFRESVTRFYTAQLVLALGYLHAKGVIYRDLKPENVMLTHDGYLKLADFGLSKEGVQSSVEGAKSFCGTPEYLAPEILDRRGHGTAVDWWSLGMLVYEMLTGLPPWYTRDRKKLYERLRSAPLEFPQYVSREARSLIMGLLTRDPLRRLGARDDCREIQSHPFFAGMDWVALLRRELQPAFVPCAPGRGSMDTSNFDRQFTTMAPEVDPTPQSAGAIGSQQGGSPMFPGFTYEGRSDIRQAAARGSFSRASFDEHGAGAGHGSIGLSPQFGPTAGARR